MKVISLACLVSISMVFSGCFQPSIPSISEQEVNKYEDSYMKEYEQYKATRKLPQTKWIQPVNKKEECKVYVGGLDEKDKTQQADYKLFWDGECKEGYAHGLGREIEQTMLSEIAQIGYYSKGMAQDYCVMQDDLQWIVSAGECNYGYIKPSHMVTTIVKENMENVSVEYHYGSFSRDLKLIKIVSPFIDKTMYVKSYDPIFAYEISDFTSDEFEIFNWKFAVMKDGKQNGYGYVVGKNGKVISAEAGNGFLPRIVILPQSYRLKTEQILNEIENAGNIALIAQEKALIIKKKYLEKICKSDVKVSFMDNEKYKAICYEDKKIVKLKIRIDEKLAKINEWKKQKRDQMTQQQLIQARQMEASAAQQRANAADTANFNQSMQNLNLNNQLQQLNTNLMMKNFLK